MLVVDTLLLLAAAWSFRSAGHRMWEINIDGDPEWTDLGIAFSCAFALCSSVTAWFWTTTPHRKQGERTISGEAVRLLLVHALASYVTVPCWWAVAYVTGDANDFGISNLWTMLAAPIGVPFVLVAVVYTFVAFPFAPGHPAILMFWTPYLVSIVLVHYSLKWCSWRQTLPVVLRAVIAHVLASYAAAIVLTVVLGWGRSGLGLGIWADYLLAPILIGLLVGIAEVELFMSVCGVGWVGWEWQWNSLATMLLYGGLFTVSLCLVRWAHRRIGTSHDMGTGSADLPATALQNASPKVILGREIVVAAVISLLVLACIAALTIFFGGGGLSF